MSMPRISLLTALVGAFALYQWQARRFEHAQTRKLGQSTPKPHEESRWEGEGGALRETGAHMGPDPKVPN